MKNGGPVYPNQSSQERGLPTDGMTMRQAYKLAALQGIIANDLMLDLITEGNGIKFEFLGKTAGELADAMIAEDEAFEKRGEA